MLLNGQGSGATIKYAVSLERLYPAPPDGLAIAPNQPVTDEINPLADSDAFAFVGRTIVTYRVSASIVSGGFPSNVCFAVFRPGGASAGSQCTDSYHGVNSIQLDLTPLQNGTHLVLVYESGYDGTVGYNLNIGCLLGVECLPPPCNLKDNLTYDAAAGTLTMHFTIGNEFPGTWNAWLSYQNTLAPLVRIAAGYGTSGGRQQKSIQSAQSR